MTKFRKKPIVVEAERWFPSVEIDGVYLDPDKGRYFIDTLEGRHTVSNGDWIITGVKGKKYPCKPDIFEMTYELVVERLSDDRTDL